MATRRPGTESEPTSTADVWATTGRDSRRVAPFRSPAEGCVAVSLRRIGGTEGRREVLLSVALGGLLLAVALNNANGSPEWLTSGFEAVLYVAFATLAVVLDRREDDWRIRLGQFFLTGLLFGVVERQRGAGIPEEARAVQVAALLVLFLGYPFVRSDGLDRLRRVAPFVVAAAMVVGAHFYHVVGLPGGSALASFPVVVGLILLTNLFFVPQHVSRDGFFWATSVVAALVVAAGLAAYVVGPYELFGFEVRFWTESLPVPFAEVPVLRSTFGNPNSLGLLAFAGTVTAAVEAWEGYDRGDPAAWWPLAAVVLVVDAIGLLTSYSRASILATAVALGLYGAFLVRDRRVLPPAAAGMVGLTGLFLTGVAVGVLPVDPGKRFGLWAGAVETYLADPTLFGAGIVVPGELMEPYVPPPIQGDGPHNSYLMILLRAGLVGFLGYLALTIGSVALGLVERRSVDVGVLALCLGWAVHQAFEAYTLFQYSTGAVLASLAVGYLVFDRRMAPEEEGSTGFESLSGTFRDG